MLCIRSDSANVDRQREPNALAAEPADHPAQHADAGDRGDGNPEALARSHAESHRKNPLASFLAFVSDGDQRHCRAATDVRIVFLEKP